MMRISIAVFILIFISASAALSQNASTYFPSSTGYKWFYKNTPLDSVNAPLTNLATFQADSFASVTTYQGLTASKVVSKSGLITIGQPGPYTDTLYYNFQSTNGSTYLNANSLFGNIGKIDSTLIGFLTSLNGWYSTYRFAQTVNSNYTILSRDTTITIDTLTLPIRVQTTGRRLNDQTIGTVNGNYLCKKFIVSFILSYGISIPPLPTIYIPLITRPDTVYIASDIWVVKDVVPSVNVDLTGLGFPVSFFIPGSMRELTPGTTGITNFSEQLPGEYYLEQNYPNPFNPSTHIVFGIPKNANTLLEIFDSRGSKLKTLINEELKPGKYSFEFSGTDMASGMYYYMLTVNGFKLSRKMLLLK